MAYIEIVVRGTDIRELSMRGATESEPTILTGPMRDEIRLRVRQTPDGQWICDLMNYDDIMWSNAKTEPMVRPLA